MNQKIQVTLDKCYGNDILRPACPISEKLCKLTGHKTFTQQAINICKDLGYEFEIVLAPSSSFKL